MTFSKVEEARTTIIVVDNDADAPMRSIVDSFRPHLPFPIIYDCEPKQGPASARNRCLDLVPPGSTHIAFIDDDEVPRQHWLDELLWTAQTQGASIVQGPVHSIFPDGAPHWLRDGRFLEFGPYRNGQELKFGYGGNVLIAAEMVRGLRLRFEERFNQSGGEDQYFIMQAMRAGHVPIAAADAVVEEWVPKNRTTLRHVLLRSYGHGATLSRISVIEQHSGLARAVRAAKGAARVGLGLIQIPAFLPRGRKGVIQALCNVFFGAGCVAGLAGHVYAAYSYSKAS